MVCENYLFTIYFLVSISKHLLFWNQHIPTHLTFVACKYKNLKVLDQIFEYWSMDEIWWQHETFHESPACVFFDNCTEDTYELFRYLVDKNLDFTKFHYQGVRDDIARGLTLLQLAVRLTKATYFNLLCK